MRKIMKKIALLLLFVMMMCVFLASCEFVPSTGGGTEGENNEGENNEGDKNEEEKKEKDNLIYDSDSELYLVYDPAKVSFEQVDKISGALLNKNVYIRAYDMNQEAKPHEIVIGNVGRAVSDSAYLQLDRIDLMSDVDLRYCIYSDGSSIAIAYDESGYIGEEYALEQAIDAFLKNYVKEELVLAKGTYNKTSFNVYDYLADVDSEYYEERWKGIAGVAGTHGSSLVSALQALYSLYDGEKLINWIANLYDSNICVCYGLYGSETCEETPFCGTGGFYYSNSARDNFGYLPDAESTRQAVGFLSDSGICAGIGGKYTAVVPDWMGEQLVGFIYNLQDPDGFFYHPQWGKSIGDSRRSRDYNWCLGILGDYGVKTKYQTIGDLPVEETSLTLLPGRLGTSSVAAVSKVMAVESETLIPDHLKTTQAFKEYLIAQDVPNKSYVAGNNFSSQSSQIRARGKEYCDILIDHLNECQYDNGTWHHTVNYYAVNGIMKISGVYSGMKATIPNADLACKAAFAAVSSDQETGGIVDIWNTWAAVDRVLGNIKTYGDGEEAVEALREEILANAASAIIASREKLSAYVKPDGSFSYKKTNSSATSQGVPVAIPNTNEGDVNATVIGSTYMISSIFSSLGLGSYKVTICRTKERAIFTDVINNLSPVTKGGGGDIIISDPIDFDYDAIGEEPIDVSIGSGSVGIVVADPRGEGNVLSYESGVNPGSENKYNNNSIKINNQGSTTGARVQVFEGEFCFEDLLPSRDAFRIEMGSEGDVNNTYRIVFRNGADGIELWESSANSSANAVNRNLGVSAKPGEWFKLRIEYYKGDHSSVRIKVFFNDKLCAVSDNYYDPDGLKLSGVGTPKSNFKHVRFYALNAKTVKLLLDDLHCYSSHETFIPEELAEEYRNNPYAINVDKKYTETIVYDFEDLEEGENYPEWLTVGKSEAGTAGVKADGEDKELILSGGSYVYVPSVKISDDANCSVFGATVLLANAADGNAATISLAESEATNLSIIDLTLAVVTEDGVKYAVMKDTKGKTIPGVKFPASEKTELRIDYYENEKVALVYVNGNPAGLTSELTLAAKRVKFAKAIFTTAEGAEIALDDLHAERATKNYDEATAPKYDGKIYDFTTGLDGVTLKGDGVALGNGRIDFTAKKNGSMTVPATNRDDVVSMTTLAFDICYSNAAVNGTTHEIKLTDADGNIAISFVIGLQGGTAHLYEKTALGVHKQPIVSFSPTDLTNLKFELFEIDGACKIYLNGEFETETLLIFSEENAKLPVSYAVVSTVGTGATFFIDNVSLDRVNKLYTASPKEIPESEAEKITFDYATGNSFSNKISSSINSAARKPTVVEVNKNGEADKALRYETLSGSSMDYLGISVTKNVSGAVSYVFETDFMIEISKAEVPYQVWFCNGSAIGMQLNIATSDGKVMFYHGNQTNKVDSGKTIGEWMTLRVEHYYVDGKTVAKIYVNGVLNHEAVYHNGPDGVYADTYVDGELYSSVKTKNNETVVSKITKIEFRALKATVATSYFDNISFVSSTEQYKEND